MKNIFLLSLILVLALLAGAGVFAVQAQSALPSRREPENNIEPDLPLPGGVEAADLQSVSLAEMSSNLFGYTVSTSTVTATGWIDAQMGGVEVTFTQADDGHSQSPVNIGFNFPFFEFSYSSLYVSTNGLVSFGQPVDFPTNELIPRQTIPNNFIAPFWDDLIIVSGVTKVYSKTEGSAPNRRCVIEFRHIARLAEPTRRLNFEIIMNENGDIDLLYKTLVGVLDSATIGIEDAEGVDGVLLGYNQTGLYSGLALQIQRPAADYRVKTLVPFQSGLVSGRFSTLSLRFRNAGDHGSDRFTAAVTDLEPGWSVSIAGASPDTGLVAQSGAFTLTLQVTAPSTAQAGNYTRFLVTARSQGNPAQTASSEVQVAAPSPFVYAFSDSTSIRLGYASEKSQFASAVDVQYTGASLALAAMPQGKYVYGWEKTVTNSFGQQVTYLEFILFDRLGGIFRRITRLTDHTFSPSSIYDMVPAVAVTSNGNIGFAWLRQEGNLTNVYFKILDPGGFPAPNYSSPRNITGQTQANIYEFSTPRIISTSDDHFVIGWYARDVQANTKDLWIAIFNVDGSIQIKAPTMVRQGVAGSIEYDEPGLYSLSEARALLVYKKYESSTTSNKVEFIGLDSNGNTITTAVHIPGAGEVDRDAVQLSPGGPVLLAWTLSITDRVGYTLIANSLTSYTPIQVIVSPLRSPGQVSVGYDKQGRGIIIWMDSLSFDYFYYALVGADGSIVTPAMLFRQAGVGDSLTLSTTGQGVAYYEPITINYLPVVRR